MSQTLNWWACCYHIVDHGVIIAICVQFKIYHTVICGRSVRLLGALRSILLLVWGRIGWGKLHLPMWCICSLRSIWLASSWIKLRVVRDITVACGSGVDLVNIRIAWSSCSCQTSRLVEWNLRICLILMVQIVILLCNCASPLISHRFDVGRISSVQSNRVSRVETFGIGSKTCTSSLLKHSVRTLLNISHNWVVVANIFRVAEIFLLFKWIYPFLLFWKQNVFGQVSCLLVWHTLYIFLV